MSDRQRDPLDAFQMLKEAFEGNGASEARVRALIGAHVTSNLLLAEKVADLDQMLGLLVHEMQQSRLARSGSNGSREGSSRSGSTSTPNSTRPPHPGSGDE